MEEDSSVRKVLLGNRRMWTGIGNRPCGNFVGEEV